MVQYKRKLVQLLSPPTITDENAEVWVMARTGEVFTDYESYLHRRDFYQQKKFTCDITGHSGLTFFEALDSETEGSREVNSTFPEALREPVLRKVQFSTISRIDDLVNFVFDAFKTEFFVGEHVIGTTSDGERVEGIVRDKVVRGAQKSPDATMYFVKLEGRPGHPEAFLGAANLARDRRLFTKQILRSFLKNTIVKESWIGAPWTVKKDIAEQYRIDSEIPPQLKQGARMTERKANAVMKGSEQDAGQNTFFHFLASQQRPLDIRPGPKGHKIKLPLQDTDMQRQAHIAQYQQAYAAGQLPPFSSLQPGLQSIYSTPYASYLTQYPNFQPMVTMPPPPKPAPPPPIKYPIDDMEVQPKSDGVQRPALRFLSENNPLPDPKQSVNGDRDCTDLRMRSVGPLLEIWNTLNVYCEVFVLDSFTLDDFLEAMQFSSEDVECELLKEVHCAVLKQIVDENGAVKVKDGLPKQQSRDSSEEATSASATPAPEEQPPARSTRSSLAKSEAAALQRQRNQTPEPKQLHRAEEMLADYGWQSRLKARDFQNGGWQTIMVGLLSQLSLDERQKQQCDEILAHLAPIDMEPTQETARSQYVNLDVNLRIAALEMVCMLAIKTNAIRDYMESQSELMTTLRKQKIEQQRAKKAIVEELRELDEQRKLLLPDNLPSSPVPEADGAADTSMTEPELEEEIASPKDSEDEEPISTRTLRRGSLRANERKRKREEEEARREKERKEKEAAKTSKQSAQFKKILRDIEKKKEAIKECEDKIADIDSDLREANVARTKVLGRDRFCNRYYWFERNGMPFGGIPSSSTAHYGYANGRIWVQGPDELERKGYIELSAQDAADYRNAFGMTVLERKAAEEGPTGLRDSMQWGYYDDAEAVDQLIGWLDDRGKREKDLRKELQAWRDVIAEYMDKMRAHLDEVARKKQQAHEEQATRVSTRHKTYVDLDHTKHQCLAWTNTYAVEELGHLHSEQPRPRQRKLQKAAEARKLEAKVPQGKTRMGTRQGGRGK